jgi:transcription-repair coupling factor (superfamily II helicase)
VGYDLYCRLLEKAVRRAKKQPAREPLETSADLGLDTRIPEDYLPDLRARIEAYRRLAGCRSEEELAAAEAELRDRFGPAPEPLRNFARTMLARIRAARWSIASLAPGRGGMVAKVRDAAKGEELRRRDPSRIRLVDAETLLFVGGDVVADLAVNETAPAGGSRRGQG